MQNMLTVLFAVPSVNDLIPMDSFMVLIFSRRGVPSVVSPMNPS